MLISDFVQNFVVFSGSAHPKLHLFCVSSHLQKLNWLHLTV